MLKTIFESLDRWIQDENRLAAEEGSRFIKSCEFKILGQTALMEAQVDLVLAQTADVDAYTDASYSVIKQFDRLLAENGMHLDPLSKEVWMPEETTYTTFFEGQYVKALFADPLFVLLSKTVKAPDKNRELLVQYIASEPEEQFFQLCEKYEVDLERLISD